jgi:hypothetical protein
MEPSGVGAGDDQAGRGIDRRTASCVGVDVFVNAATIGDIRLRSWGSVAYSSYNSM